MATKTKLKLHFKKGSFPVVPEDKKPAEKKKEKAVDKFR